MRGGVGTSSTPREWPARSALALGRQAGRGRAGGSPALAPGAVCLAGCCGPRGPGRAASVQLALVSPPGTGRVPGRRTEDTARSLSLDVPSRALPEDPAATSFSHRPEACHMVTSGSKGGWGMPFMKWRTVPRGTKCPVGREEGVRWRVGDGQVCEKHRRALGGEAVCGCTWDVCAWVRVTHACVHVCACCVRTMRCGMRVIVAQVHV